MSSLTLYRITNTKNFTCLYAARDVSKALNTAKRNGLIRKVQSAKVSVSVLNDIPAYRRIIDAIPEVDIYAQGAEVDFNIMNGVPYRAIVHNHGFFTRIIYPVSNVAKEIET